MKNGQYELVRAPDGYPGKRYRGRYAYEHIVVWWQNTGAMPPPGCVVHHKNHQKRDNRFDNLECKTATAHNHEHSAARQAPDERATCKVCGREFDVAPSDARRRRRASANGEIACSRSCGRASGIKPLVHGTRGGYLKKCRCSLCQAANASYSRHRKDAGASPALGVSC